MATVDRNVWGATVFAFRGYNVANLGRTAELLEHPQFSERMQRRLSEASAMCSEFLRRRIDLESRVRNSEETNLGCFDEAVALILAAELAQIDVLQDCIGVDLEDAKFAFGYSLGEIAALIAAGVFDLEPALEVLMAVAGECAAMAHDVSMGVIFTRDSRLDLSLVMRECSELTAEGSGVIAPSSILSPNGALVLGQGDLVDQLRKRLVEMSDGAIHVRKNQHRWPPLHTPLLWDRGVADRAGALMLRLAGAGKAPSPPVMSLATGGIDYTDYNFRDLLRRWIDHPQQLWEAIEQTLHCGAQTVVHVGPAPNLVPATFRRLSENVAAQTRGHSLRSWGMWAAQRNRWLASMVSSDACLLRAPQLNHVILEDWLLERTDSTCPVLNPIENGAALESPAEADVSFTDAP